MLPSCFIRPTFSVDDIRTFSFQVMKASMWCLLEILLIGAILLYSTVRSTNTAVITQIPEICQWFFREMQLNRVTLLSSKNNSLAAKQNKDFNLPQDLCAKTARQSLRLIDREVRFGFSRTVQLFSTSRMHKNILLIRAAAETASMCTSAATDLVVLGQAVRVVCTES